MVRLRSFFRALARFVSNILALLRAGPVPERSNSLRAQRYALAELLRTGFAPAPPSASFDGDVFPGIAAPLDQGVIEVRVRRGLPNLSLPVYHNASPFERRRTYERLLALIGYVQPTTANFFLHLTDDPGELADAAARAAHWVFNRKLASPSAWVVVPDPHFVATRGYEKLLGKLARAHVPWDERRAVALFRGSTTGGSLRRGQRSADNPRVRLCLCERDLAGALDAKVTRIVNADAENAAEVRALDVVGDFVDPSLQARNKYLVSIDGWAGEWDGLYWKLWSGSVVLRVESSWAQWYTDRLEPFVHYVPVRADLADLAERIEWCRSHDEECKRIAERARELLARQVTFCAAVHYTAARLTEAAEATKNG